MEGKTRKDGRKRPEHHGNPLGSLTFLTKPDKSDKSGHSARFLKKVVIPAESQEAAKRLFPEVVFGPGSCFNFWIIPPAGGPGSSLTPEESESGRAF